MGSKKDKKRHKTTKKASKKRLNKWLRIGLSGLAGAVAVTLVHESVRRFYPNAPRMDILGMRAIAKGLRYVGQTPPPRDQLHTWSLVGDIISNGLYYSLTGGGKKAIWRGTILGALAGVGGVALPGPMGLGTAPSNRTKQTQALTIGYYLLAGVVAGGVAKWLRKVKR
ncbi:hypothetical protein [Rufibacter immobilis]|uniref:hypothetical protein n=1 Tax=Rufibacter immobilis TaxID=1348778 RepID=UPI001FE47E5B|nr:hypothetical protein [Rufibacter immobilis]